MSGMIDVAAKTTTDRKALARGSLRMGQRAFSSLKNGRLPKGNPLPIAEAAGILAAKRASSAIPLCHPLPLDFVRLNFVLDPALPGLHVFCEAGARAKTGVEMEALAGALGALLAVYDVVKQVDPALSISDVRLERKQGGKTGFWRHPLAKSETPKAKTKRGASLGKAATITVSDRCFDGRRADISGKVLREGLKSAGFSLSRSLVVADDPKQIAQAVKRLSAANDFVALTGGTGLSARDVTPETVAPLCDRLIPGIAEALRAEGLSSTPLSALSRTIAGQRGRCLIVCLPGSVSGVRDALTVLDKILPHALSIMAGKNHG